MLPPIALFGPSGAGKTEVANYLQARYGYVRVSTGSVCRSICKLAFNSESKSILNQVTDALKAIREDVWLSAALREAPPNMPLVFDSMRFRFDYEYLVARGFRPWRVDADLPIRVRLLKERGQEFTPGVDDRHPAEIELDGYRAEVTLTNSGQGIGHLQAAVDAAMTNHQQQRA